MIKQSQARGGWARSALITAALTVVLVSCGMPAPPQRPAASGGAETGGRSVVIGNGRTLFLECKGEGSPTVILESGIHDSSEYWVNIQPNPPAIGPDVFAAVAEHTRVCRYDRPGTLIPGEKAELTDRSTPVRNPRTLDQVATDLDALIRVAELEGPFLLVGHSFGGWLQTYYAQTHRDEVAGLVLVDAFSARMPEFMGDKWTPYEKVLNSLSGNALENDPGSEKYDVLASVQLADAAPKLRNGSADGGAQQDRAVPVAGGPEGIQLRRPRIRLDQGAGRPSAVGTQHPAHHRDRERPLHPGTRTRPRDQHHRVGARADPGAVMTRTGQESPPVVPVVPAVTSSSRYFSAA